MIPRSVHLVWLGGPLPDRFAGRPDEWRHLNPGWEVRVWRDEDLDWLRNRSLFEADLPASTRSNVARFELLHRFGGVYADLDMRPVRPLEEFIGDDHLVLAEQTPGVLNPALMAGGADHPFLAHLIAQLPISWRVHVGAKSPTTTGPHFLTRTWRRWSAVHGAEGTRVLAPHVAYPVNHLRAARASGEFPHSLAVHEWDGSWIPDRTPRRSLRAAAARLRRAPRRTLTTDGRDAAVPSVLPAPDGHVLVTLRPGAVLLGPGDERRLASMVVAGEPQDALIARALLRPGDAVVLLAPPDPVVPVIAGWTVRRAGRVFVVAAEPSDLGSLDASITLNQGLGMKGTVEAVAPEAAFASGPTALLARMPRIDLVWVAPGAGPRAWLNALLTQATDSAIDTVVLQLDDEIDPAGWDELAGLVRELSHAGWTVARADRPGAPAIDPAGLAQAESPLALTLRRGGATQDGTSG